MLKRLIFVLLVIGQLLLLFFVFRDSVIYAKSGIQRWLPFLIVLGGIPASLYYLFKGFDYAPIIAGGSVLLIGPLFGTWAYFTAEADLKENGVETRGKIIEHWGSGRNVKCIFSVNGRVYETFTIKDNEHKVEIGDSVTVIYSQRNPENNNVPILQ